MLGGTEGDAFRDFRFQSDSATFESWSYGDGPDVDTIHRNQVSGACPTCSDCVPILCLVRCAVSLSEIFSCDSR